MPIFRPSHPFLNFHESSPVYLSYLAQDSSDRRADRGLKEGWCGNVDASGDPSGRSRELLSMLKREQWLDLARKLDWDYSYVDAKEVFPEAMSGTPWLPHSDWKDWDEPYRTSYAEYVANQHAKEASVQAVREAVGRVQDFQ